MEKWPLTVTCFYWSDPKAKRREFYKYTPEHVYILKRMVKRNLTIPHDFVCVTDKPEQFDEQINTVPLDRKTFIPGTMFAKLMLWRRDIGDIIGGNRILYLDLDCVIIDSLDPIVDRPENVVLWHNPKFKGPTGKRTKYNTSIILLTAGTKPKLYEKFKPKQHPAELKKFCTGDDQGWVSYKLGWDEAHWTDMDGIYTISSLKGWRTPGVTTELPENARIIFFSGKRTPQMEETQAKCPWIRRYI